MRFDSAASSGGVERGAASADNPFSHMGPIFAPGGGARHVTGRGIEPIQRVAEGRIGDSIMTGFLIAAFAAFLLLAYFRAPAWLWTAGTAFFLAWLSLWFDFSTAAGIWLAAAFITVAGALNLRRLRRRLIRSE